MTTNKEFKGLTKVGKRALRKLAMGTRPSPDYPSTIEEYREGLAEEVGRKITLCKTLLKKPHKGGHLYQQLSEASFLIELLDETIHLVARGSISK